MSGARSRSGRWRTSLALGGVLSLLSCSGLLLLAQTRPPTPVDGGPRRVEVLVVNPETPDHDQKFACTLKAALSQYGFNFSPATPGDLTPAGLAAYDAVVAGPRGELHMG